MTPFCLSSAGGLQSTTTVLELKGLAATSRGSPGTGQGQEVRREARTGDIMDRNTTPQQTAMTSAIIQWKKGKVRDIIVSQNLLYLFHCYETLKLLR